MTDRDDKKSPLRNGLGHARETYWDAAAKEAAARVGRGPQLKGAVHEVALRDGHNLTVNALVNGQRTQLVKATNARTVDVVTLRADGRVLERIQAKDLTSDAGLRDLRVRLGEGQYRSTRLVGTEETAKAWNATSPTKAMRSSGVSSETTTRAAHNTGSDVRAKALLASNARDIARFAGGAAAVGAIAGAAGEAIHAYGDLRDGTIDGVGYAKRVVIGTAEGAASAGGRTAAALTIKEGTKQLAIRTGTESLRRVAGSNAGTAVAFAVVEQGIDTVALIRGTIDGSEYGARTTGTLGTTGGAYGGALAGAALGSVVPVVGNAVGAVIGGLLGAFGGGFIGRTLGRSIFG
jgi:hypothetical protein